MYKNSNLIKKYLIKYGKNVERTGDALHCLVCNQNVVVNATTVSRHVRSNRYITGGKFWSEKWHIFCSLLEVNLIIQLFFVYIYYKNACLY